MQFTVYQLSWGEGKETRYEGDIRKKKQKKQNLF